jgi:hypothetical protein
MTIKYNLGQRLVAAVSVLLISLFLQSCNQFSNPLIPILEEAQWPGEDNQQLDSQDSLKEVEDKNLLNQGELIGGVEKVEKTKQEFTKNSAVISSPLGKFDTLPRDLLPEIFSYLGSIELGQVRQLNKSFYKLTTGYERPGIVGVENKPSTNCLVLGLNTHTVDFKKVQGLNPETISSFAFYRLMGEVRNLPSIFWAYIKGTNVHTVNLSSNKIGDSGVAEFAKNLQGTSVHTVNLYHNQIGDSGTAGLAKNLQGTSVLTIDLGSNLIDDSGAAKLAKNLQGTSVHTVKLSYNYIGDSGAAEFVKNLQGTSVHTIYLDGNQIGDSGAAELAKNLQGTKVHTIDLESKQISDQDTFYLWGNQIGYETQNLLKQQYTNIQWSF